MATEVEDVLQDRARGFAGLTSLIGASTAARFHPVKLPDAPAYPACTFNIVSATAVSAMGADTGIRRGRFSVTCWAKTFKGARDLATQVRKCFQRYSGTYDGAEILQVWLLSHIDLYDDQAQVFYRVVDFQVDYRDI